MNDRPAAPRPLQRALRVEAGHRCAIPTCRRTPIDLAHIEPWHKVREHEFSNMIALCPTCHRLHTRGEIDTLALRQYKANLALLNGRYGDLEIRVLHEFAKRLSNDEDVLPVVLPTNLRLLMSYLISDSHVALGGPGMHDYDLRGVQEIDRYALTESGRELVEQWMCGGVLE